MILDTDNEIQENLGRQRRKLSNELNFGDIFCNDDDACTSTSKRSDYFFDDNNKKNNNINNKNNSSSSSSSSNFQFNNKNNDLFLGTRSSQKVFVNKKKLF